jgi:hypothetical protein
MMALIVILAVFALVFAFIVAVGKDPGPSAADAAVGYETAWDRLDFVGVWTLSGSELRDGLGRKEFVATKRAAYRDGDKLGHLVAHVGVDDVNEQGDTAAVLTRLELHDGSVVQNRVDLARRDSRWVVTAYSLHPSSAA